METTELYKALKTLPMSPAYASQISRGIRQPSTALAIDIYRTLGVKLGPIADSTDAEIDALENVEATRARTKAASV